VFEPSALGRDQHVDNAPCASHHRDHPAMPCSYCEPWRLADIPSALDAIAGQATLAVGSTYVAVFDLKETLIGARHVPDDHESADYYPPGTTAIGTAVTELIGDDIGPRPPEYVTHLIRCRDGRVVWGPDEPEWGYALMYAVQMLNSFVGEVIVVTPHGWTTGRSRASRPLPTLNDLSQAGTVVPFERPTT
jgi:hypothetical protein